MTDENRNDRPSRRQRDFAADVLRLTHQPDQVPPQRDAQIRQAIRRHFAQHAAMPAAQRCTVSRRRWSWAAAAAAVALVATVWMATLTVPRAPRAIVAQAGPADVDRSGRVDILDAFALARQLEAGTPALPGKFDLNRDGLVDHRDVDAIARRAVALNGEGQS